ncbi:DUF3862 domain-containing protein [Lactobacillus kullabergensis]|uniref:DUF3862 domain-containing protein n=1 Tax=Lactobacillus kullabergensis TaxID=1218493 RepID=UPI0022467ED2|nr:DUF3862 domain-containing protein [Lactobacillus kullabergensis]MCX0291015.1 DUF3862 domain-containing protein [Lactobacillus kullabergensis]
MNKNLKDGKNNQPIYQKIWFWVLIILALFALIGGAYGIGKSSNNSNNAKTEQKSESKPTDESNNTDDEKIYTGERGDQISMDNLAILQAYYKVKLGDLMKSGQGGTSYKKVKHVFNSGPSETSSSETSGVKTEIAIWRYDDVTITITFVNNHAVGSTETGLRWKRAKPTFTKKNYNKLSSNLDSEKIYKKFGIPDEVTQMLIFGSYKTKFTWFTGLKGSLGANVSLDFTGDSLTGKSQYGLK